MNSPFSSLASPQNTAVLGSNLPRTDRNNNPIAVAMSGRPNEATKALDAAGIPWSVGDQFPGDSSMQTIRINGDPMEGARAILSNSPVIQNWYIRHTGSGILPKFGVQTNEDFKKLSAQDQNIIIQGIHAAENGSASPVLPTSPFSRIFSNESSFVPEKSPPSALTSPFSTLFQMQEPTYLNAY